MAFSFVNNRHVNKIVYRVQVGLQIDLSPYNMTHRINWIFVDQTSEMKAYFDVDLFEIHK